MLKDILFSWDLCSGLNVLKSMFFHRNYEIYLQKYAFPPKIYTIASFCPTQGSTEPHFLKSTNVKGGKQYLNVAHI